jgi:hypothetical protein
MTEFESPEELIEIITEEMASEVEIEEDQKCNFDLEQGLAKIFTCIKNWNECKSGDRYYVRIDNPAEELIEQWAGTPLEKSVREMSIVYWVYVDNGLGTPKRRVIFDGNFSEYFS